MSKESMKLALEALQKIYIAPEHEDYIKVWWPACEQAITALREALAEQPAHQQEPVAWRVWRGDAYELFFSKYAADRRADCFTKRPDVEPLYTSPPAQRHWVGLTDEDIEQGCKESWVTEEAWQSAVWWAENKLRSKNT